MVEQLDARFAPLAKIGHAPFAIHVPFAEQGRVVYLQDQTCVEDGLVFDSHRITEGELEGFGIEVVLVFRH